MSARLILMVLVSWLAPTARAAGMDIQLFGGSRSTTFAPEASSADAESSGDQSGSGISDRFEGVEIGASVMGQPLPLLPVAFGAFAMQQNLKGRNSEMNEKLSGLEAGVDLMAWIPLGMLQPFARFGYDLYGSHKYTASSEEDSFGVTSGTAKTETEIEGKVSGYHGAVGVRLMPTPFVGAFLQVDFAREIFKAERASEMQDGAGFTMTAKDVPKIDMNSRSIMIGVDVGT